MVMARSCDRRLRTICIVVLVTYALSNFLYVTFNREPPSLLLLANATWWKANMPPYNMSLLADDLKFLVDKPGFKFLINNKRCEGSNSIFLVVFIHSAPANFRNRQVIRDTWGREDNLPQDLIRVVFLLGSVTDPFMQRRINQENNLYHDIVQGNFFDSYRNLTYKHVMGLKWVTHYCRQARFIFKADDDIFVDIFQLTNFLKETFGPTGGVANIMMCYVYRTPPVKRSQRSKWRVSFKEYPGRYYPSYCAGWGIILSPDVVFKLYLQSSKIPYFWVDDVHVTGTLAELVGVSHLDFTEKLDVNNIDIEKWIDSKDVMRPYLFGTPNSDMATILTLWNRTLQYYQRPALSHR
ncbi:beta-1,3-galactosyltransferase 1 isoform X2 [Parasteatoda tepidariorum]|uniref:beta-1,3-galactosyltransferase 1 isoform X2 n=1 Tax=Parasteatoda tepidariorum TaxID=114398 RepID=UPI00077FB152|nr:beta-1,3-galactosyltransferase 1-like isoform X2 [Parasteatoda tepidariorum]